MIVQPCTATSHASTNPPTAYLATPTQTANDAGHRRENDRAGSLKSRMIRHPIGEIGTAELAVGEVELRLLAQAPFRADAGQVADYQHSQHQLRID